MAAAPKGKGSVEISDEPLGKGGEGSVFSVTSVSGLDFLPDADKLVAKIYHEGHGDKSKVRAMLLSPPDSDSVAWPLAALFAGSEFKGFLMKKLDFSSNRPWSDLAHSGTRRKTAQDFDVMYAMTAVRNFAVALDDVHSAGHYVGDVNESNMFVGSDAQVMLVDTDSAQVVDPKSGKVFACLVGKPEYTAAEISHGKLKDNERTVESDMFGFAVAAYQMLLGGPHPADGIYKGSDDPPPVIEKIRQGVFPALQGGRSGKFKAPPRVAVSGIPSEVQSILLRALDPDPKKRPDFDAIIDALDETSDHLVQCSVVKQHWYDSRDKTCGWCAHATTTGIDPWVPAQKAPAQQKPRNGKAQRSLSGVNFGDGSNGSGDGSGKAQRLPPQRAGGARAHAQGQVQPGNSYGQGMPHQGNQGHPGPGNTGYGPGANNGYQGPPQGQYGNPQAGYAQAPAQQYQPPTQKELQKQFKTKKTVLSYVDGTYAIRPSIGELMKSKPKLAFSCLRDETPPYAAFWWSNRKAVPVWWALIVGNVIAAGFAILWLMMMHGWLDMLADYAGWEWEWIDYVFTVNTYTAVAGVSIASLWMTFSGLAEDIRYKRRYGSLKNINKENWLVTILRYVSISIIWGPILMVGTVVGLVLLVVNMIIEMARSGSR